MISYTILVYAYIKLLNKKNISWIYPIIKIFSVLIVVGFGFFTFGEILTLNKYIGILLGCISLYILSN